MFLNLKCVVHPLGRIEATIPDIAIVIASRPLKRSVANKARYKKVFPVPPGPFIKKAPIFC